MLTWVWSELTLRVNTQPVLKDVVKPDGDACNTDETLKDAQDIEWQHSPSDLVPPPLLAMKQVLDDEEDRADLRAAKKTRVSSCSKLVLN